MTLCAAWGFMQGWGQQITVTGSVSETKTKLPVEYASVALLRTDSSVVAVNRTDEYGHFCVSGHAKDSRILKISQVGYETWAGTLSQVHAGDTLNLGNLSLPSTENMLNVATVSAALARVEQKGDTTQFNAGAYRVPEGSTLQTLVKQLPGVEIDDNGKITWNGKEVKEFLVNGKDFFKGDTETAMKNLPTDLISRIKAYDKKSDYTELTGIDDGEERTVLDIATKAKLKDSWNAQVDGGYGNHDRYTGRTFISRFGDKFSFTAYGSLNNINDKTIGGGRRHRMGKGIITNKNAGLNFSWENQKEKRQKNHFEIEGDINYRYSNVDLTGRSNAETFLSGGHNSSFENSWKRNAQSSTDVQSDFKVQWNITPRTIATFRPYYSYSERRQRNNSLSATFNADPSNIAGMTSPLDSIFGGHALEHNSELYEIWLNANRRQALNNEHTHNVGGSVEILQQLNKPKRNLSLNISGEYTTSDSYAYSISDIQYNSTTGQEPRFLNQYSAMPSEKYNYRIRANYTEPFGKGWNTKIGYTFSFKHTKSDRSRYNLDSLAYEPYRSLFPGYENYGDGENHPAIGVIPLEDEVLNAVRDLRNSQYATYEYMEHSAMLGIRFKNEKIRFNADLKFNPEHTRMRYNRPGQHIDTLITRNIFKVAPTLRFKYKFSNTSQFDFNYFGYSSEPSMTNLLAVVDDANPLNVSMGNPGLEPSWNNQIRLSYNNYAPKKQRNIMTGLYFNHIGNAISNRMIYDEQTGIRYTRPENIDGNWNMGSMTLFSTGMGKKKLFNLSSMTAISYNNAVGYTGRMDRKPDSKTPLDDVHETVVQHNYDYYDQLFARSESVKNTTRNLRLIENLKFSYRGEWFEIGLKGRTLYQHARATIQENANIDSWDFSYGGHGSLNFKFGLNIYTEIDMESRRGYSDASMNTNELIWNAQISQSFLRNRAATLSLDMYDILRRQTSISRQITATQRIDSWNNAINSFFMVRFTYQLNLFNSKNGKGGKKPQHPGGYHHPHGGGQRPMMMHMYPRHH